MGRTPPLSPLEAPGGSVFARQRCLEPDDKPSAQAKSHQSCGRKLRGEDYLFDHPLPLRGASFGKSLQKIDRLLKLLDIHYRQLFARTGWSLSVSPWQAYPMVPGPRLAVMTHKPWDGSFGLRTLLK